MSERIKLVGAETLRKLLARGGKVGVEVLTQVLREESLLAFRTSQRMVPHATGVLRASGVVRPPAVSGSRVLIDLGYGGAASAYAMYQHENLSLNHPDPTNPNSDPAGKAKYLETPVRNQVKGLAGRLRRELDKRMKR